MNMKRKPVNKDKSAKEFRRNASKTKAANIGKVPNHGTMRGGYRL